MANLTVHYNISTKHVSGVGEVEFKTKTINSPLDNFRRFLYCPGCDRLCSKVHLCNTWACAKCHGLHYRRQLIDKDVARWERRQELQELVGRGRPKGMHNPTYIALREELYRLQFKLRGRARKWASCEHDLIIQAQWMAGSGIDLWSSQYAVRGDDFVRVGETFAPRGT